MKKLSDPSITDQVPPQELTKYNRESGNKTRYFVGAILLVIVALTCLVLYLVL